jgi:hypothetical protein
MNADELIDLWVERVKQGEPVELPWRTLRQTIFKDGLPHEGWQRMVEAFAVRGVAAREDLRGKRASVSVWVVLSWLH